MFQKFRTSKNQLLIATVFVVGILVLATYADIVLKKNRLKNIELQLFQIGKDYEFDISKELEKYSSLAELISVSFSNQVENNGFVLNSKKNLLNILSNNKRISAISLVLKTKLKKQEGNFLFNTDSSLIEQINLVKINKGDITETYGDDQQIDLSLKAEIEKVVVKEQTKVLSPHVKRIGNDDKIVIPVVSSIFEGKRYVGYLIFYVKLDWDTQIDTAKDLEYKAYVSTGNGKLMSIKDNELFLSENIKKVCFTCPDLLNETGSFYNSSLENGIITICLSANLHSSINQWGICLRSNYGIGDSWYGQRVLIWVISGLLLLACLFVLIYFNSKSEKPWSSAKQMISNLSQGSFSEDDYKEIKDENFIEIKNILANLNESLNKLSEFNKLAISGNFDKQNNIINFKHAIASSSLSMYQHLEKTNKQLTETGVETEQIKTFTSNLEEISKVLKLHHKDVFALSEQVIKSIVDLMDIAMGAVFLAKQKKDETVLELVTSYAYHENKYQKKEFKLGESLVGACAAEKRTVHLKKIPNDYLKILSGLGEASPSNLLIIPLIFEDEVLGVIELGSLNEFDEKLIHFAESASLNIASTLSLAQNNIRNSELLEQTRKQTKELEEQERKMKEALAELKKLQAKTAQSEAAVRSKLEAMNNTLLIVEYTTEGVLLDANYKFLNTMHYSLDEIKGNNVIELLKEKDREELLKVINMVKSGNFYESLMRRHTKEGTEKWFMASYSPVFNDEGSVQNILFFGIDITKIKVAEEKLSAKIKEMTEEIEKLKK